MDRGTQKLAQAFGREPELVLACLQSVHQSPVARAKRVLEAASAALAEHPDYADLRYYAAQAAIAAGEFETAAALLEQALLINPGYRDALLLAARLALVSRPVGEARARLQGALSAGADYPDLHMLMGSVWQREGNLGEARASFQRALELNPNLTVARAALAGLPTTSPSGKNDELPA